MLGLQIFTVVLFINEWILSSLYNDFLCLFLQFLPFSLFLSEMTIVIPTSFGFYLHGLSFSIPSLLVYV